MKDPGDGICRGGLRSLLSTTYKGIVWIQLSWNVSEVPVLWTQLKGVFPVTGPKAVWGPQCPPALPLLQAQAWEAFP